jgi:hypothetical protein
MLFSAGDHWLIRSNTSSLGNIEVEGGGVIHKLFRIIDGTTSCFSVCTGNQLPGNNQKAKKGREIYSFLVKKDII